MLDNQGGQEGGNDNDMFVCGCDEGRGEVLQFKVVEKSGTQ